MIRNNTSSFSTEERISFIVNNIIGITNLNKGPIEQQYVVPRFVSIALKQYLKPVGEIQSKDITRISKVIKSIGSDLPDSEGQGAYFAAADAMIGLIEYAKSQTPVTKTIFNKIVSQAIEQMEQRKDELNKLAAATLEQTPEVTSSSSDSESKSNEQQSPSPPSPSVLEATATAAAAPNKLSWEEQEEQRQSELGKSTQYRK